MVGRKRSDKDQSKQSKKPARRSPKKAATPSPPPTPSPLSQSQLLAAPIVVMSPPSSTSSKEAPPPYNLRSGRGTRDTTWESQASAVVVAKKAKQRRGWAKVPMSDKWRDWDFTVEALKKTKEPSLSPSQNEAMYLDLAMEKLFNSHNDEWCSLVPSQSRIPFVTGKEHKLSLQKLAKITEERNMWKENLTILEQVKQFMEMQISEVVTIKQEVDETEYYID